MAPRHEKPTKEGSVIFFFLTRSAREEGSRDNAVRNQGSGISMVHRCRLRPAGGESERKVSLRYN
jgi:hypothetical protein